MRHDSLIPKGFRLVALTVLPGTGGAAVRAYYHAGERELFLLLTYYRADGREIEERVSTMGPLPVDLLQSVETTFRDLLEMKTPHYIEEPEG